MPEVQDIFDKVASPSSSSAGGDIFDKVAAKPAATQPTIPPQVTPQSIQTANAGTEVPQPSAPPISTQPVKPDISGGVPTPSPATKPLLPKFQRDARFFAPTSPVRPSAFAPMQSAPIEQPPVLPSTSDIEQSMAPVKPPVANDPVSMANQELAWEHRNDSTFEIPQRPAPKTIGEQAQQITAVPLPMRSVEAAPPTVNPLPTPQETASQIDVRYPYGTDQATNDPVILRQYAQQQKQDADQHAASNQKQNEDYQKKAWNALPDWAKTVVTWADKPMLPDPDQMYAELQQKIDSGQVKLTPEMQEEWGRAQRQHAQDKKTAQEHPVLMGTAKGSYDLIRGLTSPLSAALLVSAPESKIMSAFFAMQAAQGTYENAQAAAEAFKKGENAEAIRELIGTFTNAAMATMAGTHAALPHADVPLTAETAQPADNNRTFTGPATAETMAQRRGTPPETVPEPVQPPAPPPTPSAAAAATPEPPPTAAKPSAVPFDTGGFDFDQYEAAQRAQTPPAAAGDRPVVQGSTDHAAIRESAATQEKPTVAAMEKAVEDVPGAEVTGSRVKDEDSQLNKADRDKPVETQKDHLGVRVAVDDDAAHRAAVGAIAQKLPVVGTEPLENNGLAGTQVFVQTGRPGEANQTSEIQVVPKSQVEAMKETDALYDQQKEALAAGDTAKADALGKQITEIHEAALKNEGVAVALADKGLANGKSAPSVKSDDVGTSEDETKYKFGSTQANLPEDSEAAKAVTAMQAQIDDADLAGDGKDVDRPHVTVRYGLKDGLTPELRAFIESQAPFEASLGPTTSFKPSENSDGAAPIIAPVESPELHRLNAEIEQQGDFEPSSFPEYKPHVTVAYVKPEAAEKYTGMTEAEGKTFPIESIAVTDKNGEHTEIPLRGGKSALKGGSGESPEPTAGVSQTGAPAAEISTGSDAGKPLPVKTGSNVVLPDGRRGVVKGISPKGDVEVKLEGGGRARSTRAQVKVVDATAQAQPKEVATSVDDLPKETQSDIAYILAQEVPYLKENFDEEDVRNNLFGLEKPPTVMVGTRPVKDLLASFDRATSALAVMKYVGMLGKPGFEMDPILVAGNRFVDGGNRLQAYQRAGRMTIPTVDIADLLKAPESEWKKWMEGDESADLKQAQGITAGTPGHEKPKPGAIAVDLDKTLAEYDGYKGPTVIGAPIAAQVDQVKQMLANGKDVWIYSARAEHPEAVPAIQKWSKEHIGQVLPITNVKYDTFAKFIDDRSELPIQMQDGGSDESSRQAEGGSAGQDGSQGEVRADVAGAEGGGRGGEGREAVEPRPQRPAAEAGKEVSPAEKFKAATTARGITLRPGESGEVPVRSLNLDPKRFQYKVTNIGANGVTDLLAGKRWNPDLAGVISVWRDPADGKVYVVNGHHRVDRAKATGQSTMLVRMLDVKSATEARAVGALQNIAEGRGTVIDAAKFIRDSGISVDDLEAKGISMGEKTAQDGVALSRLDGRLFDMVVHGKMSQGRGIAIGRETPDAATQDAVLKLIEAAEKRGQKVSDGTVGELARFAQTAPQRQETVGSLFGDEQHTTSTALDKAQVSANILRELGAEKRAFGAVSSADRAARLEGAGNKINAADNAQRATEAEQAQEVYLRMSSRRGPIDDILNRAAEERSHAKPSEVAAIDRRAYEDVRAAVSETLGGGEKPGAERSEGYATLSPQESISFLRRRTPSGNVESLTFPGMEDAVAEQEKSAADTKTEAEKQAVESSLSAPKGDISAAAGEMERNSPLFFGSGAGGNQTLFDGIAEPDADTSKRASDLGSTFYSNPFDPVLFKKYIGEPIMELAAPLREELERRGDIANVANSVHDTLQNLDRTNKAATLEAKGIARALEDAGFTKADGDQVFAHLEDPSGVKLTPKQEELRDQWIKPLDQRAALQRQIALLIKSGEFSLEDILSGKVPVDDVQRIAPQQENYQHRIAANKNSFVDKILGDSMKRFRSPGSALSRAFSSSKRSVFQEIRGLDGQREAVAVKGGRVTRFRMGEDGKPETQDLGDYRSRFVNAEDLLNEKTEGVSKRIAKIDQAMNTLLNSAKGRDFTQERIDSLKAKLESLKAEEERIRLEYSPESMKDRAVTRQELLDKAITPIQRKVDALNKEWDILTATPARWKSANRRTDTIYDQLSDLDQMLTAMKESITPESAQEKLWYDPKSGKLEYREEGKDGQKRSDVLKQRLTPVKNKIDRLASQIKDLERITNRTPKLQRDLERMHKRLTELEQTKAGIEDAHQEEGLEGRYWRDKDGNLWRFNRGTTKFITERTGQKYHANAMLSSLVNYMETNKAMNAAVVMERTKGLLEDEGMALKTDNPATVPEGWKPTTLLQMHGYYFPAYIADAFDQFDYLNSRGQPNVLERANRFIIQSVLMNPLMHGKNIAANAFTGKAAEAITGRSLVPSWYKTNAQAGIKAVNTLKDLGGSEYRRLLRLGLDLQGADSSFDQTTKDILRSFTDQLDKDKQSNAAMSALVGVGNAAKWLQGKNHLATFGLNDLFLLQSFYAREAELQAKGVPNASEAARDWAHQQVVEYTTPVRVGGSSSLGRLMENSNLSAFWRYHFGGILRPVMNAVKEAAGTFTPEEEVGADGKERNSRGQTRTEARTNALARLAVMTLFATVVFPKVLDRIAKKITGDQQAKAPRGGVLGFASNIAETIQGDRTPASLAGSVFTPALGTEEALESIINRDFFTGRHIMGTNVDAETKVKQLAAWLTSKTTPGQMTNRLDQGKGKQVMWSLLGFTFPLEHGLLEAAKIRSEAAGSNPSDPKAAKVWQSILAAAQQTQRSNGKDTRLKDALMKSKVLTPHQRKELIDASHESPIVFAAADLPKDEDVFQVFQHSTEEEKRQLVSNPETYGRMHRYENKLRLNKDKDEADKVQAELKAAR